MRLSVIAGGLLLGLITILAGVGEVQATVDAVPGIQWVQILGNGTARCIQPSGDGGYLLSGWKKGQPGVGSTIFLIKTDARGNKSWETLLPGNGFSCAYGFCPSSQGGMIMVGDTKSKTASDHDVFVAEVDAGGHKIWERNFGGPYCDYGAAVIPDHDGGYLVAGGTESYGTGCYDVYLIKLNKQGQAVWSKTYGGPGSDCGYALVPSPDGGYLLAGNTDSTTSGKANFYLVKIDEQGNLLWEKKYGGSNNCYAWSLQPSADGGYFVAGEREDMTAQGGGFKSYLVKTDTQGKLIREHSYGEKNYSTTYALVQSRDGGALLLGKQESDERSHDLYILKTDHTGKSQPPQTMPGLGGSCAYAGMQSSDGGYIVAGQSGSQAGQPQVLLIKLAPERQRTVPISLVWIILSVVLILWLYRKKDYRYKSRLELDGRR